SLFRLNNCFSPDWAKEILPTWGIDELNQFRADLITTAHGNMEDEEIREQLADIISKVARERIDGKVQEWRELADFILK
ncbi:hypothetical protein PENTCL1PPCAC_6140, partial [Pristionchus entomophagus]